MSQRQQGQRNPARQPAKWQPPPPPSYRQAPMQGPQSQLPPAGPYYMGRPQYTAVEFRSKLSWSEAFRLYLRDPHARSFLRFFARIAPWAFPLTIVDDVMDWIPGIDIFTVGDDLLWPVFTLAILQALVKVNRYRNTALQPPPVRMYPVARPHSWDPPRSPRHR